MGFLEAEYCSELCKEIKKKISDHKIAKDAQLYTLGTLGYECKKKKSKEIENKEISIVKKIEISSQWINILTAKCEYYKRP